MIRKLKSAAKALYLNSKHIPESRIRELEAEVLKHYSPATVITTELLRDALESIT